MKRTRHNLAVNNALAVLQSTTAQRAAADRFRQQQIDRALRRELRKYGSAARRGGDDHEKIRQSLIVA